MVGDSLYADVAGARGLNMLTVWKPKHHQRAELAALQGSRPTPVEKMRIIVRGVGPSRMRIVVIYNYERSDGIGNRVTTERFSLDVGVVRTEITEQNDKDSYSLKLSTEIRESLFDIRCIAEFGEVKADKFDHFLGRKRVARGKKQRLD